MIYKLSAAVTVSAYTEVEAESLEEAIEIAEDRDCVIGGIGTGSLPSESWIIEEADGMAQDIRLSDG